MKNGVLKICPSASPLSVNVKVSVHSLSGVRLADKVQSGEVVSFDVKARMKEKERRSDRVDIGFALSVGTRPSVAKFEVEGVAILEGKNTEIDKMLEIDHETQIPFVFQRVYQHVFMSMYLLATLIDAPYPPPNLLFSGQQQMPMSQIAERAAASEEKTISQSGAENVAPQEEVALLEEEKAEAAAEARESKVAQPEGRKPSTET